MVISLGNGRQASYSSLGFKAYLPALHSAGSSFAGKLVFSERHAQSPDQLVTPLCDKSIARGDATSGSLVGIKIKLFLPTGATVVW